tara:strand:+ start:216 stop:404 length:189 start_codon:yes stop_codon:yes gene_type:complete
MYWLVMILSVATLEPVTFEIKVGNHFMCAAAKSKFLKSNPPIIKIGDTTKESNIDSIKCVKR